MAKRKKTAIKETIRRKFSEYVRRRDALEYQNECPETPASYCRCCVCGTVRPWKEFDAGHWIDRRFEPTRFAKRNVHAQCRKCNRTSNPEIKDKYRLFIENKYGLTAAAALRKRAGRLGFWRPGRLERVERAVDNMLNKLKKQTF